MSVKKGTDMTGLVISDRKSPEQEELEGKLSQIDALESEFAQLQLEYSTFAGELSAFCNRYYLRVGGLFARLDSLRAEIKALEAQNNPNDEAMRAAAEAARKQAQETWEEVGQTIEEDPVIFQPSADLKLAYRQAAKLIHPDRADNEEDRSLRDRLMAEINSAYAHGDIDTITELVDRYREKLNEPDTEDIGTRLVKAIRNIARLRAKLGQLRDSIEELKSSHWAKLMREISEGEARGEDPLGQLAEKIHADIVAEEARLKQLLNGLQTEAQDAPGEASPSGELPTVGASPEESAPSAKEAAKTSVFRPEGLIHRTERGEKVRSKSEAIIANMFFHLGLDYRYEYPIEGHRTPGIRRPDFTFFDTEGQPILWEHLGMLNDPDYRARWNAKLAWYEDNGFTQGVNLFISRDEADGGLDSLRIRKMAEYLKGLLE